jgi:hypothetical protein
VGIDYRQVDLPPYGEAVWEVRTINRLGQLGELHRVTCRLVPDPAGARGGRPVAALEFQEPEDDGVICLGYAAVEIRANPWRIQVRSRETSGLWSIDEWVVVQIAGEVSGESCEAWEVRFSTDGQVTVIYPGSYDADGNLYADLGVD